jgi:Asp-tRNA(Asn)/Glu-tRNA(Gln) amidotransferase A subunit family amidase
LTETISEILQAHRTGSATPAQTVERSFARIRAFDDPALFIDLRDEAAAVAEARTLMASEAQDRPLYGVPVAIKDNIDVEGLPTTAACPAFAYMPIKDATVVARLRRAGAIVSDKTNLDQFATGLVGVRSPYGRLRDCRGRGPRPALLLRQCRWLAYYSGCSTLLDVRLPPDTRSIVDVEGCSPSKQTGQNGKD